MALEDRLSALERQFAAQQAVSSSEAATRQAAIPAQPQVAGAILTWPHMVDNIFLGLAALLAAHWLATTLPAVNRTAFRLVALAVALPFGFRFQSNAQSGTAGQVLAAVAFASVGTVLIGVLDAVLGWRVAPPILAQDIIASFATIALSHYAGSALAHSLAMRGDRRGAAEVAGRPLTVSAGGSAAPLVHFEQARIKTTAETVKALYDAVAPMAAGGAALWAAVGHILF